MKSNMEQIVIQGLELEAVEKIKSAERKALTRKNGLKQKDAQYVDGTTGQTRDIVATKLNMSGKHWERMKYIYVHKEDCDHQEYDEWNNGRISTSKLYSKLKNNVGILKDINNISEMLSRFDSDLLKYMENLECQIKEKLCMYPQLQERIYPLIADFKRQFPYTNHSSYALLSPYMKVMFFDSLDDIQCQIEKIKSKIK